MHSLALPAVAAPVANERVLIVVRVPLRARLPSRHAPALVVLGDSDWLKVDRVDAASMRACVGKLAVSVESVAQVVEG